MLLIGSSGTGKTLMCETLSRMLGVPFVTADATSLAQDQIRQRRDRSGCCSGWSTRPTATSGKAQLGIVFIDEIDKLKASKAEARVISGESVQHALLKIMEGAPVKLKSGQYLDHRQHSVHLRRRFRRAGEHHGQDPRFWFHLDFRATTISASSNGSTNAVKPTDLFEFGLIPEFTGRLPIIANFQNLSKEMLVRDHERAEELDLPAIHRDLSCRRGLSW